ncbi:MAG TPA: peptidoglycan editing factor PgeF [Halieaceae bacterium]|nr:peptidoglycan editing factor PgeF [Halieaceae bacterium]
MAVEQPVWPLPPGISAFTSTRDGGASAAPHDSFNLAGHVGDDPVAVERNRARLAAMLPAGASVRWLHQVHGTRVLVDDGDASAPADAAVSRRPGLACAILTADCLPVLFCSVDGRVVAAAHAGWRGLAGGVLEATIAAMAVDPGDITAWLGPAIGPRAFEVGPEVHAAFAAHWPADPAALHAAFRPGRGDRLHADLHALAGARLAAAGVTACFRDPRCTASDPGRFYSFRRDGDTGRMVSLILINP